jgi:hypothetical protein
MRGVFHLRSKEAFKARLPGTLTCLILLSAIGWGASAEDLAGQQRSQPLRGARCTYAAPPRTADGRVDVERLVAELVELHANTYRWVSRPDETNRQDFRKFLPLARAHQIRAWVTVNPPSERQPKDIRPLEQRLAEYEQWGVDFARLSLVETNFVAWSIDDFVWNLKFFTPEATRKIVTAARQVNPRFAFLPCCYYKAATARFAKDYGPVCDGVMFPYRDESGGANFTNSTHVAAEVKAMREKFGPACPIIVGVFGSRHSKLGVSAPEYVERVMRAAHPCADGISIYRHPNKTTDPEKHEIVKRLYTEWSAAK